MDTSTFLEWWPKLLESTRDHAVILIDPEGRIVAWLGASERLFGYSEAEALGQPISLVFTIEEREQGFDRQELEVAARNGRSEDERWQLRKDGIAFWASGVVEAIREGDGRLLGFCKLLRDRTDARMLTETLENRIAAHAHELARRNNFLASLVHELRNPLGPLLNSAALLERTDDRAKRHQYFEIAARQIGVLDHLLKQMYEATKAKVAGLDMTVERLSLDQVLRSVVLGLAPDATAKQQRLELSLPALAIALEADPVHLQQMLLNLVGNAIKYTQPGGRIGVTGSIEGDHAVVRVEDNGPGIAPEMLTSIFDLFTRERAGPQAPEGLGIGLAMVKELARLHGGVVEARSPGKGKGSMFALRLPLRQPLVHGQADHGADGR